MIQMLIVVITLLVAALYVVWRLRRLWAEKADPCGGCTGCSLKNQVCDKKVGEKFGRSK